MKRKVRILIVKRLIFKEIVVLYLWGVKRDSFVLLNKLINIINYRMKDLDVLSVGLC